MGSFMYLKKNVFDHFVCAKLLGKHFGHANQFTFRKSDLTYRRQMAHYNSPNILYPLKSTSAELPPMLLLGGEIALFGGCQN